RTYQAHRVRCGHPAVILWLVPSASMRFSPTPVSSRLQRLLCPPLCLGTGDRWRVRPSREQFQCLGFFPSSQLRNRTVSALFLPSCAHWVKENKTCDFLLFAFPLPGSSGRLSHSLRISAPSLTRSSSKRLIDLSLLSNSVAVSRSNTRSRSGL